MGLFLGPLQRILVSRLGFHDGVEQAGQDDFWPGVTGKRDEWVLTIVNSEDENTGRWGKRLLSEVAWFLSWAGACTSRVAGGG